MATLFRDSEHFAQHYPALESVDWGRLRPSVEFAELKYFRDHVLGATLYDSLLAAYQASIATSPTPLSSANADLHAKCLPALAHFAAYEAMPDLNVLFTSGGMMTQVGEGQQNAPMWRVNQARKSALRKAHAYLDQLVAFLSANATTYPDWASSPMYSEVRESLIPTVITTERYLRTISGSWLLYMLRPALRKAQNNEVRAILGDALDILVTAVHAGTTNTAQNAQLEEARPAMLHLALASSIAELGITVDDTGVWSWTSSSSGGQTSGGENPAGADWLNAKVRHHQAQAALHLEGLRQLVQPTTPSAGRMPDISGPFMMS